MRGILHWIVLIAISFRIGSGAPWNWTISPEVERSHLTAFSHHPLRYMTTAMEWLQFLRNKQLVFIGDSLTRYQYLNLVQFLNHLQWNLNTGHPPVEMEKLWASWEDFMFGTNALLGCNEICTAYRLRQPKAGADSTLSSPHENRYYRHPELNLTIAMFVYTPPHELSVQLSVDQGMFDLYCRSRAYHAKIQQHLFQEAHNSTYDIFTFLDNHVQPMRPDVLLVNQGIWKYPLLREERIFERFLMQMKAVAKHAIWKTTTPLYHHSHFSHQSMDTDELMGRIRASGVQVFDAFNITVGMVEQPAYWDKMHFLPFMYTELNIALLQQLHEMLV